MRALLLLTVLLLPPSTGHAQDVTVSAIVPPAAPTGSGMRDLSFGVITPLAGATQNIEVVAAAAPVSGTVQAGEFSFNVASSRGIAFNVVIPIQLTASGLTPLALSSNGPQYGGYCAVVGAGTCTLTNFNPSSNSVTACAQLLGNGSCHPNRVYQAGTVLRVYVGGRLAVPPTARAGVYTGTVTMTIVQVY